MTLFLYDEKKMIERFGLSQNFYQIIKDFAVIHQTISGIKV